MFGLAYGSVKLSLRGQDGEERVLQLVSAGQTFGEANSLLGRPGHGEAIALADSKLVVIPATAIFALMDRETRFARAVALLLAERTLEMLAEVESAMQRGAQRLASYLARSPSLRTATAAATGALWSACRSARRWSRRAWGEEGDAVAAAAPVRRRGRDRGVAPRDRDPRPRRPGETQFKSSA